jgi:hypothetical protein
VARRCKQIPFAPNNLSVQISSFGHGRHLTSKISLSIALLDSLRRSDRGSWIRWTDSAPRVALSRVLTPRGAAPIAFRVWRARSGWYLELLQKGECLTNSPNCISYSRVCRLQESNCISRSRVSANLRVCNVPQAILNRPLDRRR